MKNNNLRNQNVFGMNGTKNSFSNRNCLWLTRLPFLFHLESITNNQKQSVLAISPKSYKNSLDSGLNLFGFWMNLGGSQ